MTLTDARTELKGLAPPGWAGYDYLPATGSLPCWVVGLPETVSFKDVPLGMSAVRLPIYLCVGPILNRESEIKLLQQVMESAKSLPTKGTSYKACVVDSVSEFSTRTIGTIEALSASIIIDLII